MLKTLIGSSIVAAAILGSASWASDADIIREARDRADIEVLIWNYVQAMDNFNDELYATYFTEDGSLCCAHNQVLKGRAEIKKLVQEQKKARAEAEVKAKAGGQVLPKPYHPYFNSHIEFRDRDHAHIDSYWFSVQAQMPPNGAPKIGEVGRCSDEVVRVNGKWLIQSRNIFP